jgi:4a-hydroxytetrahydrobiopterin dehydratase
MAKPKSVSPKQAALKVQKLNGWKHETDSIVKQYNFENFHQTMAFVNALAWIAHRADHHPDMEVGYNKCKVRYSTHSVGGLSDLDFQSAEAVDKLMT